MLIKRDHFLPLQFKMAKLYFLAISLNFANNQDLKQITFIQLCEDLQNVSKDTNFTTEKPLIFPLLPQKYKGSHWSVKVYQKALQTYLTILGTYKFVIQN